MEAYNKFESECEEIQLDDQKTLSNTSSDIMPSKVQPVPVKFIKSIMILQIIILSLLLILLIGVIAQGLSGKHQSDHLTSSITEILKTVQDLTIYKKKNTDMLA